MANEFWTSGKLEPKRQYRWQVNIGGAGNGAGGANLISYIAKKVNKPEITVENAEHKYLNHTYYYPGRTTWNTVSMTLIDPISPDASYNLAALLAASGYRVPIGADDITTIEKANANTTLGAVTIMQFAGAGDNGAPLKNTKPIETWTLNNPFIKKVNFGSLDYSSEDLVEIELEIMYDFATFTDANNSSLWGLDGI